MQHSRKQKLLILIRQYAIHLTFACGVLLTIGGIFVAIVFPVVLDNIINWRLKLVKGNRAFEAWRESSIPMKSKIYIFDVQNAQAFLDGKERPILQEKGPYVYNQYRRREDIIFSYDGERASYSQRSLFYFDHVQTKASLNDIVTVPNIPIITFFTLINSAVAKLPFSTLINGAANQLADIIFTNHGEKIFQRITVKQFLEGRRYSLLDDIDSLLRPLRLLGLKLPYYERSKKKLKDNKFGIIWMRNDTKKGLYEVYTTSDKFSQYYKYNGKSQLQHWKPNTVCSRIQGTNEGMFFGRLRNNKQSSLRIFNSEACRLLRIDYEKENHVKGISTWRYRFSKDLFSSQRGDSCYCSTKSCVDGASELSPCFDGAPLAISYPHFLYADYQIVKRVYGLKPNDEKHRGYVDIEPTLGFALNGSGRFQLNVIINPINFASSLSKIKTTLLPFIWFEEEGEITDSLVIYLKLILYPINIIDKGSLLIIALGILTAVASGGLLIVKKKNTTNSTPVIKISENFDSSYFNDGKNAKLQSKNQLSNLESKQLFIKRGNQELESRKLESPFENFTNKTFQLSNDLKTIPKRVIEIRTIPQLNSLQQVLPANNNESSNNRSIVFEKVIR